MNSICHITSAHLWNDVRIFSKECVSLANNGFQVSLIAFNAPDKTINNVRIINAGKKPTGRINRFLKSSSRLYNIALNCSADVYHFHDPDLISLGKKLARKGKKVVYDIHEDVPRQLLDKPYLSRIAARVLSRIFEVYENKAVRNFAALVCATPHIRDRFVKKHTHVLDINNYPLMSEVESHSGLSENKEDKVCYIGAISKIRGLKEVVQALKYTEGISLDLAGNFHEERFQEELSKLEEWKKVNHLGVISREHALQMKASSIAGIVTFLPAANHIHAQPNKIFEYMASALPVICSNFSLWKDIIEANNCGICVNPFSAQEIAQAIMKVHKNPDLAKAMGEKGRQAVLEKYNWHTEEQKLIDLYLTICKKGISNTHE